MNEKKIKVYAEVGELLFDVYVTVSQEAWDEELDSLEEEVRDDIANCEGEDEDFNESTGYIGNEGHSHNCTSAQARMAYHVLGSGCEFGLILARLGALEQLRDAIIKDLVEGDTEHQYEEELQMLKGIKNYEQAMLGYELDDTSDSEEDQVVYIWDRYPLELLDELAKRIDGVS